MALIGFAPQILQTLKLDALRLQQQGDEHKEEFTFDKCELDSREKGEEQFIFQFMVHKHNFS